MNELKPSAFLTQIMETAAVGQGNLTAERFLLALLEKTFGDGDENNSERRTISQLLQTLLVDRAKVTAALQTYLEDTRREEARDVAYMNRKMEEAWDAAKKNGRNELTSILVLRVLLKEPTQAIAPLLKAEYRPQPQPKEPPKSDFEKMEAVLKRFAERKAAEAATEQKLEDRLEAEAPSQKQAISNLIEEVNHMRGKLEGRILGQDHAVNVFLTGYFQASMLSMIDPSRKRPRATFLFAGPPGVGKTFLAEQAAKALALPFARFDMSEYSDKEANLEFCGSDKVYKNGKAGNVTGFVAANPKCVLLFDEIEKAHRNVIHLFLQMLDAGRLRDNYTDEEVSFTDTIIIFTTNAGRQLYAESDSGDFSSVSRKVVIQALEKDKNPETGVPYFPGAICSRFASGNVVMFNHIGAHDLRKIAKMEIQRHGANLERETGIRLLVDEPVYTALLLAEGGAADARTIRGRAETFFNDELYELLRLIASHRVKTDIQDIADIRVSVDLRQGDEDVVSLFVAPTKAKILLFAGEETAALCRQKMPEGDFYAVQDVASALQVLKGHPVDFVLLDMQQGAPASLSNLNLEDVDSPARDFFRFLREQRRDLPTYLLEAQGRTLTDEERVSFLRQGVRGVLRVTRGRDGFAARLAEIAVSLHQQAGMNQLARENKIISFETAQTVSKNGKHAQIKLFDFRRAVAVDPGDAKSVLSAVSKPNITFADVIGARDAKKELTYFVEYLKNPKKYMGTGVKAPKGVILYGPPGTGKTMLAKAMACEAGVTFLAAEGNQFLKRYVGEGSEAVHALFKTARKYAPSILFIDEIDAIAKERRGGANSGANGEETLTAFLTEMDGFVSDPSRPVFVLAATNFDVEPGGDKSLDPALMRRFDRRVYIDLPNKADRIRFLQGKIAKNHALDISQQQVDNIAMRSTGMSLAELDSVVELALRSAIREGSVTVTDAILEEAFETFNSGEVKKWDISQLERVARHEAGHAFLCWSQGETPSYLTVVARGNHGGYMQHADQEGKAIYTMDELLSRIRTALGGRAAEIVYYGPRDGISTGASGDLQSATQIAQQIVCSYGMDEDFGLAVVPGAVAANGTMSMEVRQAVNRLLRQQMQEAIARIEANRHAVDSLVEALLSQNHLNAAEIELAIQGKLEIM